MLTVNELFSGIGAQRAALERLGIEHKVVGISEIDRYAIRSYEAIYGATRNYGDISKVEQLDYADFWTYSFPCTDISVAGLQKGIVKGETRSGLLYEVQRLLERAKETDTLPKYLMLENVKNLVGRKFKPQFDEWLKWLDGIGYNTYWQVLNAKNYGVPQNRERVFAISIRKDIDAGNFQFPAPFDSGKRLKDVLEADVDEKYYLSEKMVQGFVKNNERHESKGTGFIWKPRDIEGNASCIRANNSLAPTDNTIIAGNLNHCGNDQMNRVYSPEGNSPTITTVTGGGREQKIIEPMAYGALVQPADRDYKKNGGKREEHIEVFDEPVSYALRANNHGALVATNEPIICASRGRNPENPSDRTAGIPTEQRLEVNTSGTSNALTTVQKDNYVCEPQFRIRKLTPKECWRLMGFTDESFEKAEKVCSNSQLYKQAGNSIVVDVLYHIFKNLFGGDSTNG